MSVFTFSQDLGLKWWLQRAWNGAGLGLIFFWNTEHERHPELHDLPFGMDAIGAADFARLWLAEQNYGNEPDHDGDNGKGWRLYNEAWGRVGGHTYSFVAIKPAWAMYGK